MTVHFCGTCAVQDLLDYGADANQPKVDGETPLHEATRYRNADIVRVSTGMSLTQQAQEIYHSRLFSSTGPIPMSQG